MVKIGPRLISRRRGILASLGIIWLVYGISLFTAPAPINVFGVAYGPMHYLNCPWIGLLWIVDGSIAFLVALCRRPKLETLGFNCLLAPPLLWATAGLWSWIAWIASNGQLGTDRGWVTATVWSAGCVVTLIVSGWVDHFDHASRVEIELPPRSLTPNDQ